MAQQTAVEWLMQQRNKYGLIIMQDLEQALAMEKEQIINAWEKAYSIGCVNGGNDYVTEKESDTGINYYNKTYNK